MEPFDLIPLASPHAVDKAWGEDAKENAFIELYNLIAAAEGPANFGPRDLQRISRRHGVDLSKTFHKERRRMYQDFLNHLIEVDGFNTEGRRTLSHLARTLRLSADDTRSVHEIVFGVEAIKAVEDGRLELEERLVLYRLLHTLNLDSDLAEKAYDVIAAKQIMKVVAHALEDGVITSEEVEEIEQAYEDLNVPIPPALRNELRNRNISRMKTSHPSGTERVRLAVPAKWRMPTHESRGTDHLGTAVVTNRRLILREESGTQHEVAIDAVRELVRRGDSLILTRSTGPPFFLSAGHRTAGVASLLKAIGRL